MYRIGSGYDVHRLVEGRKLIVGGVEVPHSMGLDAHSDGDVLVHALCDALLGAAALGDIGAHFPDTSADFKNVDSRLLLAKVCELLGGKGYAVVNVDCTIVAQRPKFAPFISEMRAELARVMCLDVDLVGVKATTTEKLGFEGREEGISAQCVAMIKKNGK